MLKLQQVKKVYAGSGKPAVDGLTLDVRPGEIFGFIGPNGAGKTTTIKMITGILPPNEGTITVNGHDIKTDPVGAKRCIGYVPDEHIAYDRLKGIEYLNFVADIYGVSSKARKERIEKYLSMFEIAHAANDRISAYSHGMKQKLMITGALLSSPPLWILDEPMTGLDPKSAHLLKQEMRSHCDLGNTVFFSTHVLDVAERLCDRVGIISGGRLIAVGTIDELKNREGGESLESIFLELTSGDGREEE
ncbi:MAG: ABC transporter ATP-binding protein [Bacillota bacterium]|nr:ABC transporter ATP-binding protein [Bacillota bacterium]